MMESILVLTHADSTGSALTRASLEAITAGLTLASSLGAPLTIGLVAADGACLSNGLPDAKVLLVEGGPFAESRYATDAAACEALCRASGATVVVVPAGARFARVAAGVAHRLGGVVDTHITALDAATEGLRASRSFYRQRIEAVLSRDKRPWLLLLDAGVFAPWEGEVTAPAFERVPVETPATRTTVTGVRSPLKDEQTIRPEAKLLFVAGAGWTKKQPDGQVHATEAGQIILEFLRQSGASLGSSKSLVDQGGDGNSVLPFLTHMNQVGQTGATPRHSKGLSTCCHGEEPHVVGWRFIGERRAISLDANCGWTRGKADVVYVADAFEVVAELNRVLAK